MSYGTGEFVQEREWTCPDHNHPQDHVCDCNHCGVEHKNILLQAITTPTSTTPAGCWLPTKPLSPPERSRDEEALDSIRFTR